MKPGAQIILANAVRLYAPVIVLFAFTLLAARPPGQGVGFAAGLAAALGLALHALAFGAAAFRTALPPLVMRFVLAAGVIAALVGAAAPAWPYAAQLIEAGLAATTAAAASLTIVVLFGRAPTLRDADW